MDRGTELPANTATSSSTSLPPRAPDLLRQAQAVFKRHRPLTRIVPPSSLGDMRLMGAAPDANGEAVAAAPLLGSGGDGSNSAREIVGAVSRERLGLGGAASVRQVNVGSNAGSELKSRHLVSSKLGLVQVEERQRLSSSEKVEIPGSRAHPKKDEYVLGNEVSSGSNFNQDEFQRRNSHQEEMFDVKTLSAKKDLFSTGGSSCSSATCLTATSAPMSSSFQNRGLSQTREEFNVYGRPKTEGNSVVTFQPRSADKSSQMLESTRVTASAPDVSVVSHEVSLPKSQNSTKKEAGSSEVVHVEDKYFNDQQKIGDDFQSRDLALKKLASNTVVDTSKPSKVEKNTRKKNQNSDVFFKVNGKRYQNLGKIGSGGSSEVHKVISSDCTIYALKKINLKGREYSAAYGFCQEIEYLKTLKGRSHIIELIDYEVTDKTLETDIDGWTAAKDGKIRADGCIYMVLEYGEIDLAHMLLQKWRDMNNSNSSLDENWLRFYWQQILLGVNTIHEERIVHSDLKPANFLLVRGSLKLIDFGIAKAIMNDTTNIQRDAQVGTLNYMSPEAFMWNEQDATGSTIKCGRLSDIWSLGCILYQMVYGRTPFSEYKTFWSKFKVITDRNYQIKYESVSNPCLIDLMKRCLAWDKDARWRIPELMKHPFLNPPVLPHTEPSPSYHVKLLMEIAESYSDNQEVYGLCSKLQMIIENLEGD